MFAARIGIGALVLALSVVNADDHAGLNAALFHAIRTGDNQAVADLLRSGADVNARGEHQATPLMWAAQYSTPQCLKRLLDSGADPNAKNAFGSTALIWAAGDVAKVKLLLAKGADPNAQASSGRTALMAAATSAGNIESVKLLLDAGADVKARDAVGAGTVMAASDSGDASMLRLLLAKGGDPNDSNPLLTSLIYAASSGNLESVKILIAGGADVNRRTPRRPPVKAGQQELGELTALLAAAPWGNPDVVKTLLNAGAAINARDMRGMTPLMLAVTSESQNLETVQILIAKGAEVNVKDKNGRTALEWALLWGETPIVKVLRAAGARDDEAHRPSNAAERRPEVGDSHIDVGQAVEKSVALLQQSSVQFFNKSGCGSCHHQFLTGELVALAREKGLAVDEKLAAESMKQAMAVHAPDRELALQRGRGAVMAIITMPLLVSLAAQNYPASELTDAFVHDIAASQGSNGAWRPVVSRPPMTSTFSATAQAIRALQAYAPEGRRLEFAERIQRARAWLLSASPQVTEERVMQLLGLRWSDADPARLKELAGQLIAMQRDDGGWAQRPGFESDAYATGETLYALHYAGGLSVSHTVYRKGVQFLLRTQLADGSWLVRSRSVKFQPYFESGFPHGHDQWISASGTAWGAMALATSVETKIAVKNPDRRPRP